ncbi:MAG: 1-deoxy-D-xylulose-5-phosphate synthase [Clostridiaceae bacterium]|nr:1-deoxy-D-xylulose-5-phosphate synthase [Clostridiaceae bacterium]
MGHLLDQIQGPGDLRQLNTNELEQLAAEIRSLIIKTVAHNGGHLASNLGVVELTIALLIEFDFRRDQIVFDVGHQVYAWKILTGRKNQFDTLRQYGGLSGFPKTSESCFDFFNTGHSSTSISAALGLSRALSHDGRVGHTLAVIGDGALTGGMAFEALNDAGQSGEDLIVILNDNQMSIGRNVGGLSHHLENLRVSTSYIRIKTRMDALLQRIPVVGRPLLHLIHRFKRLTRLAMQHQGVYFEQLGFRYYGPIDGHDLPGLLHHLRMISTMHGPVLLHVLTQKGRGYRYAEEAPDLYHGVAPFVIENGLNHDGMPGDAIHSFSEAFGRAMVELARRNPRICAISAAMTAGTGLNEFSQSFPARFYDVGIAEQHAMTLAAGLAAGGMQPVVALYSTFFQRAYDQLLHDVCLQNLPVVLVVDRAGIVGEDGETHQGIYDLSILLPLPNLEIFCPADYIDLQRILPYALSAGCPVAIRYPRGREWPDPLPEALPDGPDVPADDAIPPVRRIHCLRRGDHVTIAALGTLTGPALQAAAMLAEEAIQAEVLSVTCVKPLDIHTLIRSVKRTGHVLFLEEVLRCGGFGQATLPDLLMALPHACFSFLSIEDQPLCQGNRNHLLSLEHLDPPSIAKAARDLIKKSSICGEISAQS